MSHTCGAGIATGSYEFELQSLRGRGESTTSFFLLLKPVFFRSFSLADVDGSLDALLDVLKTYDSDDQCQLKIIDSGVGPITENDIIRAELFDGTRLF